MRLLALIASFISRLHPRIRIRLLRSDAGRLLCTPGDLVSGGDGRCGGGAFNSGAIHSSTMHGSLISRVLKMHISAQRLGNELDESANLAARAAPLDMKQTHRCRLRFEGSEHRLQISL